MAKVCESQKSGEDMTQAAKDLLNSTGRFSMAMGLFAARQATRLFSGPTGQAATSLDEVTSAASDQLTGLAKTALAVGTNLQYGLVDAAFDAVGLGPQAEKPSGPTTGLSMSLTRSATRRMTGVRTVASGALDRAVPQTEFIRRLKDYQDDARGGGRGAHDRIVTGLWKSEGLGTAVAKHLLPENSLKDPALPREIRPVIHVGFGSGSSELLTFDRARMEAVFQERCAEDYMGFAYEGIGAILRAYERGLFKLMTGTLGLIPLDAPDAPDSSNFFAEYLKQYPPEIQRLIAHGYGRILAFSNIDIYEAVKQATTFPKERIEPVVHGLAFAFAMINSPDLPLLLRQSAIPFQGDVRAAFQNGLIYALVFMDWYVPGILAAWRPDEGLETELIDHARQEAARSLRRGVPLAFRLENPRT